MFVNEDEAEKGVDMRHHRTVADRKGKANQQRFEQFGLEPVLLQEQFGLGLSGELPVECRKSE